MRTSKPSAVQRSAKPTTPASASATLRKPKPMPPAPGEIRIIGGLYKRSKLPVPLKPGLRPTPDRVRETLFNWLGQDLTGWRCMDVFAGTGALGFEAASRGAADVLLCEQDPVLLRQLKASQVKLGASAVRIQGGDGWLALARVPAASLQLVFLDPPFESTSAAQLTSAVQAAARAVQPQGLVYLEAPQAWTDTALQPLGLQLLRQGRAGAVHFHLLTLVSAPPSGA